MKIKNVFSIILSLICFSTNFIFGNSTKNNDVKYYSDTTYFETVGDYEYHNETIEYDTYELYDTHLERLCPNYQNYTQSNSCAPMAGTILLGYYDYTCPDLIPDFVAGFYYNGTFRYRPQTTLITTVKETLYNYMGTNSVAPGTSVSQFKSGLTSYVSDKGYNISFSNCDIATNSSAIINCFNNNLPIVLFINSYDYYPESGMSHTDGNLSMLGKRSSNSHVLVAYGYRQYKFYKDNALFRTDNYLVVVFGDGSQGYLAINNTNCIDEAYGVNIYSKNLMQNCIRFFWSTKVKNTKEILKSYQANKQLIKELTLEYSKVKIDNKSKSFISNELDKLKKENERIESIIFQLAQPSKSVLLFRYIRNMSYTKIAFKLNYSIQRIYQLLNIAIQEFSEEYNNQGLIKLIPPQKD